MATTTLSGDSWVTPHHSTSRPGHSPARWALYVVLTTLITVALVV